MNFDPYEILGVAPDAEIELIKAQYRLLVRENHPDISLDKVAANARMVEILEAWRIVSNPEKRARLDDDRLSAQRRIHAPSAPVVVPPAPVRRSGSGKRRNLKKGVSAQNSPRARLLNQVNEAAQLYFRDGQAEDAISLCHRVLKADSKNFEATVLLGEIFTAQNKPDKALVMFERAQILQPNNILVARKREALRAHQPAPPRVPYANSAPPFQPFQPSAQPAPQPAPRPSFFQKLRGRFGAKNSDPVV